MLKKSVIIAGRHSTSISIEEEFFEELKAIAQKNNVSINKLITQIDSNRAEDENLSSAIRLYVLRVIKEKTC